MRKLIYLFLFLIMVSSISAYDFTIADYDTATIYHNSACGSCTHYLEMDLVPLLKNLGIKNIVMKDYVNDQDNREELIQRSDDLGVPPKLQGHFSIIIDDKIILQGHVPEHIILDLLNEDNQDKFNKILVYQDEMVHGDETPKSYKVWGFKGEPKEYPYEESVLQYLDWFNENKDNLKAPENKKYEDNFFSLLPLVLVTGFFDGFNPCAFGVLLFFVAFLFTIKRTKKDIVKTGIIYIASIYIAYFLIGLGLLRAIVVFSDAHFMAKLGAYLIIVLGVLNIASYFIPKVPLPKIPKFVVPTIKKYMYATTLPTIFILGFLVGLCTFPCSGGVYVAILGLLAANTTYSQGLLYLVLYNIMFVLPLIILFMFASNKKVTDKMQKYEMSKKKEIKLISGVLMFALGIAILIWFV
ncbi:MAG: cytochrome c biogenesis protein CcdA [Nanoarchaeota archaeon]